MQGRRDTIKKKMLNKKKVTKYLNAKDIDDKKQLLNELNTMIKQEFVKNSPFKEVHDVTTALIRTSINLMPSIDSMIKFLFEERENINLQISPELIKANQKKLHAESVIIKQSKPRAPKSSHKTFAGKKSRKISDSDGQTDDEDDDDDEDFDDTVKRL